MAGGLRLKPPAFFRCDIPGTSNNKDKTSFKEYNRKAAAPAVSLTVG
jgi:hypothetical protein